LDAEPDAYLAGPAAGLASGVVLEDRDFVYTVAPSPDGRFAAFTHLGPREFRLGLWRVDPSPVALADVAINPYESDVEALAFSPDGRTVVVGSRDGTLRFFAAATGEAQGAYVTDEPVVSVAFHPNGRYVLAGSAAGLVTAVAYPALAFSSETRAHADEVRALVPHPDGRVFTGGWDKSIATWASVEAPEVTPSARVRFERVGEWSLVRGSLDGRGSALFAFDERVPAVVIHSSLAKAVGIDLAGAQEVTLPSSMGPMRARTSAGHDLTFKGLRLGGWDVAVCDSCVPAGAQGVLGLPFLRRVKVTFDAQTKEAVFDDTAPPPEEARTVLVLIPRQRASFDWYVNDFSVDRAGHLFGVAFSQDKAVRNRDVYLREKKGVVEPTRPGDCGAVVDVESGRLLQRWNGHHGVVATAALSPDGVALATGGWDKRILLQNRCAEAPVAERRLGWSVRRLRFSRDGRFLFAGAWTPQNAVGDQRSAPAALRYEVLRRAPALEDGR
jgi:WD40 repeat protein